MELYEAILVLVIFVATLIIILLFFILMLFQQKKNTKILNDNVLKANELFKKILDKETKPDI